MSKFFVGLSAQTEKSGKYVSDTFVELNKSVAQFRDVLHANEFVEIQYNAKTNYSYSVRGKGKQYEKAAREVLLAAKYARVIAVEKQRRCKMMLDDTNNSFLLTVPGTNLQTEGGQNVITNQYSKPRQFAGDVKFEQIQITSRARAGDGGVEGVIMFRPNGTADMAVLQIGDGKNHCTVYISAATGKGRIESAEAMETGLEVLDLDVEEW